MNERNIQALQGFNPDKGDYLVVRGKGDEQHLERKHIKGGSLPFLGRILQKIIYPSFRFKKVFDYITQHTDQMEGTEKASLKEKVIQYFHLDKNGVPHRHQKKWGDSFDAINALFPYEQLRKAGPQRQVTHMTGWEAIDPTVSALPDDILEQLPKDEHYIVVGTTETGRPLNGFNMNVKYKLMPHLVHLEKPPIVLIFCYAYFNNVEGSLETIEALKAAKKIRDYCIISRANGAGNVPLDWAKTKEENDQAIQQLLERL